MIVNSKLRAIVLIFLMLSAGFYIWLAPKKALAAGCDPTNLKVTKSYQNPKQNTLVSLSWQGPTQANCPEWGSGPNLLNNKGYVINKTGGITQGTTADVEISKPTTVTVETYNHGKAIGKATINLTPLPPTEPKPPTAGLSVNTQSFTAQKGQSVNVTISNGTHPYKIQTPPVSTKATATLSGIVLTVTGVTDGRTKIVLADSSTPAKTITVYVTVGTGGADPIDPNDPTLTPSPTPPGGGSGDICGKTWFTGTKVGKTYAIMVDPFGQMLCTMLDGIASMGGWAIQHIMDLDKTDLATHFNPPDGDYYKWINTPWRITLGIADVAVVIMLLFMAIVNILHINYDTYQIKKSLPLLIIGLVMANFSMLIARMFIAVADVLYVSFAGPGTDMWKDLLKGLGITGLQIEANVLGSIPLLGPLLVLSQGLGILLLALLLLLVAVIAVLVIVFLLYIRLAAIILLVVLAPPAFICLAFAPTSGLFKQWWSNWLKWVFMKPIMFLILWLASIIGKQSSGGLLGFMITAALTFFAVTIPFKLGGAVMGTWGKIGSWLPRQAYNKAIKPRLDRTKRDIGTGLMNRVPWLRNMIGAEATKEKLSVGARERAVAKGSTAFRERHPEIAREEAKNEEAARDLKTLEDITKRMVWEGVPFSELDKRWQSWRTKPTAGAEQPGALMNRLARSMVESQKAAEAVSKSGQWDLFAKLSVDARLSNDLAADLKDMVNQETSKLEGFDLEVDGTIRFNGQFDHDPGDYTAGIELLQEQIEKEENPEIKARMVDNVAELQRRAQEYETRRPASIGMAKMSRNNDGSVSFDEADQTDNWTEYIKAADELSLASKMEADIDPEKSRRLHESSLEARRRAALFGKQHPTITRQKTDGTFETIPLNYQSYLDRNVSGRILKILTPLLLDEAHTNALNENTDGLIKALFEKGGGGYGNVRYASPEAVQKFVQGRYRDLTPNEINAVMAQMGGAKERMAMGPDRSDSQEIFYRFLSEMVDKKFLGPNLWRNLLKKLERDRGGTLEEFVLRYSESQKDRGIETTLRDEIGEKLGVDLTNVDTVEKLTKNGVTAEKLIKNDLIPPEVIRELIPTGTGRNFQSQRDFYRRILTQVMQMPEFGGGKNPAMFSSEARNSKPIGRFSTLKGKTPTGAAPLSNPLEIPDQADQQFGTLAQQGAEQLIQANGGNIDRAIQAYAPGIAYALSLPATLEAKIASSGVKINPASLEAAIRQIAQLDVNAPVADIQAQLQAVDPNLALQGLRANQITAPTIVRRAKEIVHANEVIDGLAAYKTSEEYIQYAKAAPQDERKLDGFMNELNQATQILTGAAQNFADSGGATSMTRDDIEAVLRSVGKARGGDIDLNIDNLRKSLNNNEFAPTMSIMDKLITGFQTMKQALKESKTTGTAVNDDFLRQIMVRSVQSLEARQAVRGPATPAAAPTPPPTPTPAPPNQTPGGQQGSSSSST